MSLLQLLLRRWILYHTLSYTITRPSGSLFVVKPLAAMSDLLFHYSSLRGCIGCDEIDSCYETTQAI